MPRGELFESAPRRESVIADAKDGKAKVEFEKKDDALVSKTKLPEGDGYYDVTVTATAADGSREIQTLQVIDETKSRLLSPFGSRMPR